MREAVAIDRAGPPLMVSDGSTDASPSVWTKWRLTSRVPKTIRLPSHVGMRLNGCHIGHLGMTAEQVTRAKREILKLPCVGV